MRWAFLPCISVSVLLVLLSSYGKPLQPEVSPANQVQLEDAVPQVEEEMLPPYEYKYTVKDYTQAYKDLSALCAKHGIMM
jgi:hypothetical protein